MAFNTLLYQIIFQHGLIHYRTILVRAPNRMYHLVLDIPNHPFRDGSVSERDIVGDVLLPLERRLRYFNVSHGPRPSESCRLASDLLEGFLKRTA